MMRRLTPIAMLSATYLTVILTFIVAYLDPNKSAVVTINTYNEAHIELILLLATLPFTIKYLINEFNQTIGNR